MIKYRVKTGDTLWDIAEDYGTTIEAIMACNSIIKNPNHIKVGWVLKIPV